METLDNCKLKLEDTFCKDNIAVFNNNRFTVITSQLYYAPKMPQERQICVLEALQESDLKDFRSIGEGD